MIPYALNFILCSGSLLIVYHLFLSNESMYRFNRFYLLFSLVVSLAVPFITIQTTYNIPAIKEAIPFTESVAPYQQPINTEVMPVSETPPLTAQTLDYKLYIAGGIYTLVTLVLLARFAKNIYQIYRRRATGYTYEHEGTPILLLNDDVPPHSFLNNIYIGEKEYNLGIDPQIICHERAHVDQWHSIDIIIVELLQIVCWFNPFVPFYRKAIQLNHEFLADEAVVNSYEDMPEYQHLLLVKATQNNNLNLTSPFNYLTLKKRLIMMTRNTSAKTALYKKLLILPAVAVTLLLSCDKNSKDKDESKITEVTLTKPVGKQLERRPYRIKHSAAPAPQNVLDDYASLLKKHNLTGAVPNGMPISLPGKKWSQEEHEKMHKIDTELNQILKNISATDKARLNQLFTQMDSAQQMSQYLKFYPAPKPLPKKAVTAQQLARWGSKEYLVFLNTKPTHYTELANYKAEDFDWARVNRGLNSQARREGFKYKVELMTKPFYTNYYNKIMADQSDRMLYHIKTGEKSAWLVGL